MDLVLIAMFVVLIVMLPSSDDVRRVIDLLEEIKEELKERK